MIPTPALKDALRLLRLTIEAYEERPSDHRHDEVVAIARHVVAAAHDAGLDRDRA